jgi:solute carrier family 35 (UDP-galactose transporter), member B1
LGVPEYSEPDDDIDEYSTETSALTTDNAPLSASSTSIQNTTSRCHNKNKSHNDTRNHDIIGSAYGTKSGIAGFNASDKLPDSVKLLIGAGGIYGTFIYYGSLQEDVFRYVSAVDGAMFTQVWLLTVLEALANVVVGLIGMHMTGGPTLNIPLNMFAVSGVAQVFGKAFKSLSLVHGLSFPVATLAKSGKMAPVMAGSLFLGGAAYSARDYVQVLAIVGGTAIVSLGSKKGDKSSTMLGLLYICASLAMDGVTAGYQKRLQRQAKLIGVQPKPYDFMYWTNLSMCLTALVIATASGEVTSGTAFCLQNPELLHKIIKFSICSAIGQSFIFYTIAHFDPLVLTTVTTTRKIFSVLLSIFLKGHDLSLLGWSGIALACSGILSEIKSYSGSPSLKKSESFPLQS